MSIHVSKYIDTFGQAYFSLMVPLCEKSFTLHDAGNIIAVQRDFEGRIYDEYGIVSRETYFTADGRRIISMV